MTAGPVTTDRPDPSSVRTPGWSMAVLAVTVGMVLADSAIVTLALPAILVDLQSTVAGVAWVLIAFNLVLALTVVPAARGVVRADPSRPAALGIAVFGLASLVCALAGSSDVLIGARCVQALGGALAIVGCLELLVAGTGERRGVGLWITAGVVGTATGPVAGGLLTQAFEWQSIFLVQVPVAAVAAVVALRVRAPREVPARRDRPALGPNVTLALLSAAMTAALFLLVLLLVDGWRRSPATAALTVSVVPLAALLAGPLVRVTRAGRTPAVAAGCVLVAGGLTALALVPAAELSWTVAPQALVGLGLGLTLDRLTLDAMQGRSPRGLHGGWTIAARHIGVVLGLAILTPIFVADLRDAQRPAQEAITALVLDAPLRATDKVELAGTLADALADYRGRVPDLGPAFDRLTLTPRDRPAATRLEADLDEQLERAATRAFRNSFVAGALLAAAALLSLVPLRRRAVTR